MNSFQNSLIVVKQSINEAMQIDLKNDHSTEAKLDVYQSYIKSMKDLFIILDVNLKSFPPGNKEEVFKIVHENHVNLLTTAKHCIDRSITKLTYKDDPLQKFNRVKVNSSMRSLPSLHSVDKLIAEKPINPIDSAKFNIQKLVNATQVLLKSEKLSITEKASIQMRISRKIEENLSIARKHEDQLCKINTDSLENLLKNIEFDISKHKFLRSHPDFPVLYKNSQLFYHHILKDSRTYMLVQSHHSPEVSCLSFILKMTNIHPVVAFIDELINDTVSIKVDKENASVILEKFKSFKDTIENLSKLCCLIISCQLSDNIRNTSPKLLNILLDSIFQSAKLCSFIYDLLFTIYDSDLNQYNRNVKFIENEFDYPILLPEKFKKHTNVISVIDKQIDKFCELRNYYNPLSKMDKLCNIITDLMSIIQNTNSELEIGADELVPILVYMIIKSNSSELFLHAKYLEHLMPDNNLIGIEGYILVSIICAITFCVSETFGLHIFKSER